MKLQLLNAIRSIKFGLIRRGNCCSTYQLPPKVVRDIGTKMYRLRGETDSAIR